MADSLELAEAQIVGLGRAALDLVAVATTVTQFCNDEALTTYVVGELDRIRVNLGELLP